MAWVRLRTPKPPNENTLRCSSFRLHHATVVVAVTGVGLLLFRDVGDEALGGQQETGDGSGVLQGAASHFGRIDDASLDLFN